MKNLETLESTGNQITSSSRNWILQNLKKCICKALSLFLKKRKWTSPELVDTVVHQKRIKAWLVKHDMTKNLRRTRLNY
ncbi:hypothetical protein LEP1GSC024_1674 [Leptospira noguchii str. 2001034031]|uniref:Uncharacterized protein n=1 Tax=Leptospira noguchii str. 2001034031 TaxID=1193053 RepID=M6Y6R0_9LEPT|nr:hypothetical protein LEP1GSC024_1674 [Leptospira noguchii str. 2001034031]